MTQITKKKNVIYPLTPCTKDDYSSLLLLLDSCFGKRTPNWFANNMGHIFVPKDQFIAQHLIHKKDGRIAGAIGIYPFQICIGKTLLEVAGVGSVAVHPRFRHRGLMTSMLFQVNQMIKERGFDVSCLTGDRHRYRMYGWDVGGKKNQFLLYRRQVVRFTPENISVKIKRLTPKAIPDLMELYKLFPNRVVRDTERFKLHLGRKNLRWIGGYSSKGMAYLVYDINNQSKILELQGESDTALLLLEKFMDQNTIDVLEVNHSVTNDKVSLMLQDVCAEASVHNADQIQNVNSESTWKKLKPELIKSTSDKKKCREVLNGATKNDQKHIMQRSLNFLNTSKQSHGSKFSIFKPLPWWISDLDKV